MEIGGYLEFETFCGPEYHTGAIRLNSGRNCLAYLLEARSIKKIHLPYYLCSSVREVCAKYGVEIHYYHVNKDFSPKIDFKLSSSDYLYLVNYYGQISNVYIEKLAQKIENLIVDNSQAFFQMPVEGIDTLYTCRKFFGVPDGAYLYSNASLGHELKQDVSLNRMAYILGRFEEDATSHYEEFKKNENEIEQIPLRTMSKLTTNILKGIDYSRVREIREANFNYLNTVLGDRNELNLHSPMGPFSYPYYTDEAVKLRRKLQGNGIYIPTLWPNVLNDCSEESIEYQLALKILPIPCDQRYEITEMQEIEKLVRTVSTSLEVL